MFKNPKPIILTAEQESLFFEPITNLLNRLVDCGLVYGDYFEPKLTVENLGLVVDLFSKIGLDIVDSDYKVRCEIQHGYIKLYCKEIFVKYKDMLVADFLNQYEQLDETTTIDDSINDFLNKNYNDDNYDVDKTIEKMYYTGMDMDSINVKKTGFRTREECREYCDYLTVKKTEVKKRGYKMDFVKMVKELQKDDSQVFVSDSLANGVEIASLYAKIVSDKIIVLEYGGKHQNKTVIGLSLDRVWRKTPQEVGFLEAMMAFWDGKRISCEYADTKYSYSKRLDLDYPSDIVGDTIEIYPGEIFEGKWYIL